MADKISIESAKVTDKGVELKTSNAGKEYAAFTVMWSSGRKNRDSGEREYGPTKFLNVKVFGYAAADVAANVHPGDRVNVSGNLEHFEWQSQNGPKDDWSLFAESVSLPVPRAQQGGGQQPQSQFGQPQGGYNPQQAAQQHGGFGQPQQGGFGQPAQNFGFGQ